jgi:hypothetical protein
MDFSPAASARLTGLNCASPQRIFLPQRALAASFNDFSVQAASQMLALI